MSSDEARLLRFLLVEDDDDHAKIVARSLTRERISNSVERVRDGVEALEYLRGGKNLPPDVILLDLKLPRKDGHELLADLKADPELRSIPVSVLTTSDAEIDRTKAYMLHANSYLVKPLDAQQFRRMVQDLSLYWGIWNRPPCDDRR
jgi:CheY-like chemotaxis protein